MICIYSTHKLQCLYVKAISKQKNGIKFRIEFIIKVLNESNLLKEGANKILILWAYMKTQKHVETLGEFYSEIKSF